MRQRLAVVVDTNIFVSALLGSKSCKNIIKYFENRSFVLVLSDPIIEEYRRVLTKFQRITTEDFKSLLASMKKNAIIVNPRKSFHLCRDKEDNKFLEAAIEGKVDFIVSGDFDLLSLKSLEDIPIITARDLLAILDRSTR